MGLVLLIIIIASVVVALQRMSAKRNAIEAGDAVDNTTALVCELGGASAGAFDTDAAAYSNVFQTINVAQTEDPREVLDTILETRCDVLHLFCEFAEGDEAEAKLSLPALMDTCRRAEVKLLVLARNNAVEYYQRAFPPGQPEDVLNILLTIDRKGEAYTIFLESLLLEIANAGDVPRAWINATKPHGPNRGESLPDTIFLYARRNIKLFP